MLLLVRVGSIFASGKTDARLDASITRLVFTLELAFDHCRYLPLNKSYGTKLLWICFPINAKYEKNFSKFSDRKLGEREAKRYVRFLKNGDR